MRDKPPPTQREKREAQVRAEKAAATKARIERAGPAIEEAFKRMRGEGTAPLPDVWDGEAPGKGRNQK
jgi:hypothetical protein